MTAPAHLVILPILLPLLAGAALLLIDDRRRNLKAALAFVSILSLLLVAGMLVNTAAGQPGLITYRVGNWGMPFGIVLVLDRLSGLMVLLTALLALAAHTFAIARWHRASPHFHSIFLFLLVGLNGVFLTGDLFNLFVFLEVLLAASYGLVLHARGRRCVASCRHQPALWCDRYAQHGGPRRTRARTDRR
jgi:multicomponent K+:H+ antiporter subunit D